MATSRYIGSYLVKPYLGPHETKRKRLQFEGVSSFPSYPPEIFRNEISLYYTIKTGERLDTIARRFLGDGRYWWAICLINGISNPIDSTALKPGSDLKIITDITKVVQIMTYHAKVQ